MKKLKQDKVKRARIILSSILTMLSAIISLGFGAYLGYVTLTINYITIGTMTPAVGGLLICAGFFIFFGCIGGVISLKEIFISRRNEDKFSVYKPALISAMIYYVITAIICIIGIIVSFVSFLPSNFTWTIIGLAFLSLAMCAGAFYLVLKEMKEHKKNQKSKQEEKSKSEIANLQLSINDIHNLLDAKLVMENKDYSNKNSEKLNSPRERFYEEYLKSQHSKSNGTIDFDNLAEQLMRLEELRKAGLINDQEYQSLKSRFI